MEPTQAIGVSQLNEYLKTRFESDKYISNIYIKGEISNFVNHKSGHFYFTLKDKDAQLKCVMFSSSASKVTFTPENGQLVIAHGRVTVFVRDGIYTLYVSSLTPDGIGSLSLAYEQLKKKLQEEGLFDTSHKKPIPKIPRKIGVITSPTGAAVRDIINVSTRRFPFAEIILYPALVQGEGASESLIEGVKCFCDSVRCDVIIIGRGGGSIEDLWAFNSEKLARVIFDCDIPIISAVGHETDFTICDFVSDLRAPTPSAAAELAVPETKELQSKFLNIVSRMELLLRNSYQAKREKLDSLRSRRVLTNPEYIVEDKKMYLASLVSHLENSFNSLVFQRKQDFVRLNSKLETLNPMAIISRGYSVAYNAEGVTVKSINQVAPGDDITLKLNDGDLITKVVEKRDGNA